MWHVRVGNNHCSTWNKDTNSWCPIIQVVTNHRCHQYDFCCQYQFGKCIDNVPVHFNNVWFCRLNMHWNPCFSPPICFKQTFPIDSISRWGLGKRTGHLCHISSVSLCFGGLAKKIFWCYKQLPPCVSGQQGPQHSFWMDLHLMEMPKGKEGVWHQKLSLGPIRTWVQTQNQARTSWTWFCEKYLFFKMRPPGRCPSSLSTWKERWSS